MTKDELIAEIRALASSYFTPDVLKAIETQIPDLTQEPGNTFVQVTTEGDTVRLEVAAILTNQLLDITYTGPLQRISAFPLKHIAGSILEELANQTTSLSILNTAGHILDYSASSERARDMLRTFAGAVTHRIKDGR